MSDADDVRSLVDGGTSPMKAQMLAIHEVFVSLMEAGFTEQQALTIVVGVITSSNRGENEDG